MGRVHFCLTVFVTTLLLSTFISFFGETAKAQGVQRFDTYGEALKDLLGIGVAAGNNGNGAGNPSCDLLAPGSVTVTEIDNAGVAALSSELNRHCDQNTQMIGGGASSGGNLFSLQSTRTISQFNTRRRNSSQSQSNSSQSQGSSTQNFAGDDGLAQFLFGVPQLGLSAGFSEEKRTSLDALAVNGKLDVTQDWPSGMVSLTNGYASVFAAFSYEWLDREKTLFQSGHKSESKSAIIGVALQATPELILGINGFYGHTDGDIKDGGVSSFGVTNINSFEAQCGISDGGDLEANEWGGSVFALARIANGAFLNGELGASSLESDTRQSLCLVETDALGEKVFDVHRGIINSKPDGYRLDAKIRGGYDLHAGGLTIGPRVGLDASWTKIDAFRETETATGDPNFTPANADAVYDSHQTTGVALTYRDQDFASIQSRLGVQASLPIPMGNLTLTPFAEFTYIHEFENGQRNIVAHFAGDTRGAGATVFSFKNDEPDRNFFELDGGLAFGLANGTTAVIGGRTILSNDLYESYTVQGSVRMPLQ